MTLSVYSLGGFVLVSVAFVVLLEILSQKSFKTGNGRGVAFASDVDSIPFSATFG